MGTLAGHQVHDLTMLDMTEWQKNLLKELMKYESNHTINYGGRGHAKQIITGRGILSGLHQPVQTPLAQPDLRSTGAVRFPTTWHVFPNPRAVLMGDAPQTTREDREYLGLTISEYNEFSDAIMAGCYLNRDHQQCKLKGAKTKKLKNLRYKIKKSEFLSASMIWRAQLHIVEAELKRRRGVPRHAQP